MINEDKLALLNSLIVNISDYKDNGIMQKNLNDILSLTESLHKLNEQSIKFKVIHPCSEYNEVECIIKLSNKKDIIKANEILNNNFKVIQNDLELTIKR